MRLSSSRYPHRSTNHSMARTRYRFLPADPVPYFLTATTVNWLPLFSNPDIASILIESLRFLIVNHRIKLYAYVIMENHMHIIASAPDISDQISAFKSYTAHTSITYYEKQKNHFLLDLLAFSKLAHKIDRQYQFWQEGSHPQRIENELIFAQKVEYIHNNPVKRGYVDLPEHWRYTSARNFCGMPGMLPINDIGEE